MIGKGSFARVYLVEDTKSGIKYAVKAFSKEYLQSQIKGKESLMNEISIMKELNHENIMKLEEIHESKNSIYLVLELLEGGELFNYISVNKPSSSLAQSKPSYTNLSVTNGKRVVGIFSSRQTVKIFKPFYTSPQQAYIRAIDKKSTRELCQGPITGTYLFCSNHPGDNVVNQEESYACQ